MTVAVSHRLRMMRWCVAEPLFRSEVYAARAVPGLGTVRIGASRLATVVSLLLLISTLSALAYLSSATYARTVAVSGFLTAAEGAVKVGVEQGGVILAVHVTVGDVVDSGDPLLTVGSALAIDVNGDASSHHSLTERMDQGFEERLTQLQQQTLGISERHRLSSARIRVELARLDGQRGELSTARALRRERLAMAESKGRALDRLRKQRVITELDWMDHEALVLRLREDLLATESELSTVISQREAGLLQAAEIDAAYDVELLRSAAHMSELRMEQDRTAVSGQRVLLATRSGYIDTLEAQPGMITQPGITLLSIVPGTNELRARLLIPDRAVGGVGIGQTLRLRFDAFPHQHFGAIPAQLVSLASTISASGETLGPFRPTEPVFLGEARLVKSTESVERWPVDLREGMRFTADVELEQRTLLEWLLEPLIGLGRARA